MLFDFWFTVILSITPCLLWLLYFYHQDRYDKEPPKNIAITFLLGMLSAAGALVLNTTFLLIINALLGTRDDVRSFRDLVGAAIGFFLVVGPVEELVKFLAVYIYGYRQKEFDEPVDGIVYSATAALGFAAAENCLYLLQSGNWVIALRGPLSNPGHALFSAFWGLAMSRAKAMPNIPGQRMKALFQGLLLAAFLHGLFDTVLTLSPVFGIFVFLPIFALMFGMFFYVKTEINRMVEESPHKEGTRLLGAVIPCPNCAELGITGQFCLSCGTQIIATQEQRRCPQCGAAQRPGAVFCSRCGASLLSVSSTNTPRYQPHFVCFDELGRESIACIIDRQEINIGKTLDNHFVIEDPLVSKRHARIVWDPNNGYMLVDLQSTNGTFVNGKRVMQAVLRDGFEVRFGKATFIFRLNQSR